MTITYKMITLVYSSPKHVVVILDCSCACGNTISTNPLVCMKYGRIWVQCKSCGTKETPIILDRQVVEQFHTKNFPHLVSSLGHFIDGWEKDMLDTATKKP